ncbi:hypothetical protein [Sinirhodobacter huangdaonensis]|uniref:Relaxase n=1 Tax=Paenirhodobacter huangdaonensis TaxID=2501515 RepID=A0A443LET1_9RHOB|nr:hypothetical protein [Sinirhodobacter huangdaonensis]RWR47707.1 hypothetical protein EOW66_19115 [Sinirhodobacter huangdaonensis]
MLEREVGKTLGAWHVQVSRDPIPELLAGRPELTLAGLKALPGKHRYSVATLSFAREDVLVSAFNAGAAEARAQIRQTLGLFLEVAYAGLPEAARLEPLIGTHTHTGRLEVNILLPRAVWTAQGQIRAYNPHPPGKVSQRLWDNFRDVLNRRFGWADPLDRAHRRMTSQPNWLLKQQSEALRNDIPPPWDFRKEIAAMAECLVEWEGISDRDQLINRMQSELANHGLIIQRITADSITFRDLDNGARWRMSGFLFSDAFSPENPLIDLPGPEFDEIRDRQMRAAPKRLADAMRRRAKFNASRYGYPEPAPAAPLALLRMASRPLPLSHPDHSGALLDRPSQPHGASAHPTDRANAPTPEHAHPRPGSAPRRVGARTGGDALHARLLRHAVHAQSLFDALKHQLSHILGRLRTYQAEWSLAQSLAEQPIDRWHQIASRLETLNERTRSPDVLARTSERIAQADGLDRPLAGASRTGGSPENLGQDQSFSAGDHPYRRPDGTRSPRIGGRAGNPGSRAPTGEGERPPAGGNLPHEKRDHADPCPAGGTPSGRAVRTRADLIRIARRQASDRGAAATHLAFVIQDGQEWLRFTIGEKTLLTDGETVHDPAAPAFEELGPEL